MTSWDRLAHSTVVDTASIDENFEEAVQSLASTLLHNEATGPEAELPGRFAHVLAPSLRNNERAQVRQLTEAFEYFVSKLDRARFLRSAGLKDKPGEGTSKDAEIPEVEEIDHLLAIVREEQVVYDLFFQEICRQVSLQCKERGALLSGLRNYYASLFARVPKHAAALQNALNLQRTLNQKLSEEATNARARVVALETELHSRSRLLRQAGIEIGELRAELERANQERSATEELVNGLRNEWNRQRKSLQEQVALLRQQNEDLKARETLMIENLKHTQLPNSAVYALLEAEDEIQRQQRLQNDMGDYITYRPGGGQRIPGFRGGEVVTMPVSQFDSNTAGETEEDRAAAEALGIDVTTARRLREFREQRYMKVRQQKSTSDDEEEDESEHAGASSSSSHAALKRAVDHNAGIAPFPNLNELDKEVREQKLKRSVSRPKSSASSRPSAQATQQLETKVDNELKTGDQTQVGQKPELHRNSAADGEALVRDAEDEDEDEDQDEAETDAEFAEVLFPIRRASASHSVGQQSSKSRASVDGTSPVSPHSPFPGSDTPDEHSPFDVLMQVLKHAGFSTSPYVDLLSPSETTTVKNLTSKGSSEAGFADDNQPEERRHSRALASTLSAAIAPQRSAHSEHVHALAIMQAEILMILREAITQLKQRRDTAAYQIRERRNQIKLAEKELEEIETDGRYRIEATSVQPVGDAGGGAGGGGGGGGDAQDSDHEGDQDQAQRAEMQKKNAIESVKNRLHVYERELVRLIAEERMAGERVLKLAQDIELQQQVAFSAIAASVAASVHNPVTSHASLMPSVVTSTVFSPVGTNDKGAVTPMVSPSSTQNVNASDVPLSVTLSAQRLSAILPHLPQSYILAVLSRHHFAGALPSLALILTDPTKGTTSSSTSSTSSTKALSANAMKLREQILNIQKDMRVGPSANDANQGAQSEMDRDLIDDAEPTHSEHTSQGQGESQAQPKSQSVVKPKAAASTPVEWLNAFWLPKIAPFDTVEAPQLGSPPPAGSPFLPSPSLSRSSSKSLAIARSASPPADQSMLPTGGMQPLPEPDVPGSSPAPVPKTPRSKPTPKRHTRAVSNIGPSGQPSTAGKGASAVEKARVEPSSAPVIESESSDSESDDVDWQLMKEKLDEQVARALKDPEELEDEEEDHETQNDPVASTSQPSGEYPLEDNTVDEDVTEEGLQLLEAATATAASANALSEAEKEQAAAAIRAYKEKLKARRRAKKEVARADYLAASQAARAVVYKKQLQQAQAEALERLQTRERELRDTIAQLIERNDALVAQRTKLRQALAEQTKRLEELEEQQRAQHETLTPSKPIASSLLSSNFTSAAEARTSFVASGGGSGEDASLELLSAQVRADLADPQIPEEARQRVLLAIVDEVAARQQAKDEAQAQRELQGSAIVGSSGQKDDKPDHDLPFTLDSPEKVLLGSVVATTNQPKRAAVHSQGEAGGGSQGDDGDDDLRSPDLAAPARADSALSEPTRPGWPNPLEALLPSGVAVPSAAASRVMEGAGSLLTHSRIMRMLKKEAELGESAMAAANAAAQYTSGRFRSSNAARPQSAGHNPRSSKLPGLGTVGALMSGRHSAGRTGHANDEHEIPVHITIAWLVMWTRAVLDEKTAADAQARRSAAHGHRGSADAESAPPKVQPLPEFLMSLQRQRYGLPQVVHSKTLQVLNALDAWRGSCAEIEFFAQALEEARPLEELTLFLRTRALVKACPVGIFFQGAVDSKAPTPDGVAEYMSVSRGLAVIQALFGDDSRLCRELGAQLMGLSVAWTGLQCVPPAYVLESVAAKVASLTNLQLPSADSSSSQSGTGVAESEEDVYRFFPTISPAAATARCLSLYAFADVVLCQFRNIELRIRHDELATILFESQDPLRTGHLDFEAFRAIFALARPKYTQREIALLFTSLTRQSRVGFLTLPVFKHAISQLMRVGVVFTHVPKGPDPVSQAVLAVRQVVSHHYTQFKAFLDSYLGTLSNSLDLADRQVAAICIRLRLLVESELADPSRGVISKALAELGLSGPDSEHRTANVDKSNDKSASQDPILHQNNSAFANATRAVTQLVRVYRALLTTVLGHQATATMSAQVFVHAKPLHVELRALEQVIYFRHRCMLEPVTEADAWLSQLDPNVFLPAAARSETVKLDKSRLLVDNTQSAKSPESGKEASEWNLSVGDDLFPTPGSTEANNISSGNSTQDMTLEIPRSPTGTVAHLNGMHDASSVRSPVPAAHMSGASPTAENGSSKPVALADAIQSILQGSGTRTDGGEATSDSGATNGSTMSGGITIVRRMSASSHRSPAAAVAAVTAAYANANKPIDPTATSEFLKSASVMQSLQQHRQLQQRRQHVADSVQNAQVLHSTSTLGAAGSSSLARPVDSASRQAAKAATIRRGSIAAGTPTVPQPDALTDYIQTFETGYMSELNRHAAHIIRSRNNAGASTNEQHKP